ncbi:polcalcin Cup a 4-like isoform X2 [Pecten maximus]|nr:polcalcin Cup a 4-like isoform X2 [Pecten maximus]
MEITRTEIESSFTKYDENGDGRVSRVEYMDFVDRYTPHLHALGQELYNDYDINKDHHIDLNDFEAYFTKLDTSGDGRVSKDEFVSYWVKVMVATSHLHETVG